ncbi:MAG: acetyltransferase [Actinobacteria bacterium]|nr:acetyltransferase [Actinomycetota bacterium]
MFGGSRRIGERVGALDGVRGLAVVGVLLYHAWPAAFPGGYLGVEVFFVLSGFLVVSLLLEEDSFTGTIAWVASAARRIRRVIPAMVAFLVALVVLGPLVAAGDSFRIRGDVLWTAVGLTNWHLISSGASYFAQLGRPSLVRHLWSLAVELQFYAACPLVVAVIVRRRVRVGATMLLAGIGASALAMALLFNAADPSRAYYGTDTRIGALLTGALLALLVKRSRLDLRVRTWAYRRAAGVAGLVTLVGLFVAGGERARWMYPGGFLLCRLATVAVILVSLEHGTVAAVLGSRVPRWLGTRSYSIYLWHWPFVVLLRPRIDVGWSPLESALVGLAGALVLGELSYRLVERPFLRPRRRRLFAPQMPSRVRVAWSVAAVALLGFFVANLPSTDPIAASLRAGQKVVAADRTAGQRATSTAGAPSSQTSTVQALTGGAQTPQVTQLASDPVSHAEPVPSPTTTPPPPAAPIASAAIGDSVMLGAAGPLQARLGPAGFIDAKVSRQYVEGIATARRLRDQGRLGQVVIVHLGTNGPPRPSDIDNLMATLAGVPRVLFVTVRMPRTWEAQTNDVLRAGAARYPQVVLVDWYTYSDGHRDWFQSDGVHLKPIGAQAYADMVAYSVPPPPPAPPKPPSKPPSKPGWSPRTRQMRW